MSSNFPEIDVDILIIKENKILLGLLTNKWQYNGRQVYGVPGREIRKGETIGQAVKRNIKEEFGCNVTSYKIICVNSNYYNGHFIGIGVIAEFDGEPVVLKKKDWVKWEWLEKDEIPSNLFPSAKNLIDCYLNNKFCIVE
jgi:ADP-ribose pyrophosphatase YjhB (NUDIX family)